MGKIPWSKLRLGVPGQGLSEDVQELWRPGEEGIGFTQGSGTDVSPKNWITGGFRRLEAWNGSHAGSGDHPLIFQGVQGHLLRDCHEPSQCHCEDLRGAGIRCYLRMRVLLIVFQDWLVVGGFMFVSSLKSDDDPESKPSIGAICWWIFRASETANRWPQAVDRRFMQWQSAPIERKVVSFVAWAPSVGNETIQDRPFLVALRSWKRSCLKCHDVVCNSEYQLRWKEPVTLAMQSPYFWCQKSVFTDQVIHKFQEAHFDVS